MITTSTASTTDNQELTQDLTVKPNCDTNRIPYSSEWIFTDEHGAAYSIIVATSRSDREHAYRLAHSVYQTRGYVSADSNGMIVSQHDACAGTLTLLARDHCGRAAATVTLVFDSSAARLPCDDIYKVELDVMRDAGLKLAEVARLAIAEEHTHSRALLVELFNMCAVFGRRVMHYSDWVIEVNPRHAGFYRRMLSFQLAGPERPCPRVRAAPAVLLRRNMREEERAIGELAGMNSGRNLYAYFHTLAEEPDIALFLDRNHRPMSAQDVAYFKLNPPPVTVGPLGILV